MPKFHSLHRARLHIIMNKNIGRKTLVSFLAISWLTIIRVCCHVLIELKDNFEASFITENLEIYSFISFYSAPPEYTIGCFVLDVNIFPTVLANFQESLDYDNVLVTARSCARLAFHQNYKYFGLANNGECRVGPDMKSNFFKPQTSSQCSSSVGKTGAIYVYTLGKRKRF